MIASNMPSACVGARGDVLGRCRGAAVATAIALALVAAGFGTEDALAGDVSAGRAPTTITKMGNSTIQPNKPVSDTAGTGKTTSNQITIKKNTDVASPNLYRETAMGKETGGKSTSTNGSGAIRAAAAKKTNKGGKLEKYLKIDMKNVTITSH